MKAPGLKSRNQKLKAEPKFKIGFMKLNYFCPLTPFIFTTARHLFDICARFFISDEVFRAFALLRFVLFGTGASSGLRFSGCHVRPALASASVLFRVYYLTSGHDNHRFDVPLNRGAGTSIFRAAVASFGGERRVLNG